MNMEEIYRQYLDTVYGYLMTLTNGQADLAEELTQETFYRATQKISEFRGDSKVSTWLCQIAKYVFYQHIDKKKRQKEVTFDDSIEIMAEAETEKTFIDEEAKVSIYKKIQQLPSPMRDVVMLRLTGELNFQEIGDVLSQSENWARVTFYRAKQILGKELKQDE